MDKIEFINPEIPGFISVIIPVYNSAKYLQQMLDSIYSQTYQYFEIIIAYDTKSTDESLDILKTNASTHGLIIDIGNDTSPGVARNRGARLASGNYIIYLDADDLILPTCFENMVNIFEKYPKLDVVHIGFVACGEKDAEKKYHVTHSDRIKFRICSTSNILPAFFFTGFGMPWNWLVKRSFIIKNHIVSRDYTWGEDTIYSFQLLTKTSYIGVIDNVGYIWIQHPSSLTHSKNNSWVMRRENRLKISEEMYGEIEQICPEISSQFKKNYDLFCARELVYSIRKYDIRTFRSLLQKFNVQKIELIKYDSLLDKLNYFCFNHMKFLYWGIHKILGD